MELTEKERLSKQFTCPNCDKRIELNNHNKLRNKNYVKKINNEDKKSMLSKFIKCPHCSIELELDEDERKTRQLFCPNCKKFINLI